METRRYHRRYLDRIEDRDPNVMWIEGDEGHIVPHGDWYGWVGHRMTIIRGADVLLQTRIINLGQRVERGQIVLGTTPSWVALRKEVLKDPSLMEYFSVWHRKFEEWDRRHCERNRDLTRRARPLTAAQMTPIS